MTEKIERNLVLKHVGNRTQSFPIREGVHTLMFELEVLEREAIKTAVTLLIKEGEFFKGPRVGAEIAAYLLGYLNMDPMDIIKDVGIDLTREALERSRHYKDLRETLE